MKNLQKQYKEETGRDAHVEYNRSGYSDLYVEWLEQELVKKNDLLPLVSNNEVRVAVCSECDNYNNSQGSEICRNCYQKSHFVEQTDC